MSNNVSTTDNGRNSVFERNKDQTGINRGSVSIEQERAIAEAQGQLVLAKRFPRDMTSAYADLMEACRLESLAQVAFYSVPRAGGKVTGPSIRLAEEIARCYGNFQYGHREIGRQNAEGDRHGFSEVEVYAWDMERNNRSIRQITVQHTVDTREGPRRLRDQKDIDDRIANVASKQIRGRILALVPKWMVESAIQECRKTLAGESEAPVSVRVRKMVDAFAHYGVTTTMIQQYLKHPVDDTTGDELVDLVAIYNSLREGAPAHQFFGAPEAEVDDPGKSINDAIQGQSPAAARKPAGNTKAPAKPKPAEKEKAAPKEEKKSAPKPEAAQKPQQPEEPLTDFDEPASTPDQPAQESQASNEQVDDNDLF